MTDRDWSSQAFETFLRRYWRDRERESVRSLEEYLAEYPGIEDRIRAELQAVLPDADHPLGLFAPAEPAEVPVIPEEPRRIGRYRIRRLLGRGGQGTVYLADDPHLHRPVALKVLEACARASPSALDRFRREAEAASRLDHPGICTVYESGVADGSPYIAMRYVEGETLSERIRHASGRTWSAIPDTTAAPPDPAGITSPHRPDATPPTLPGRREIVSTAAIIEKAARALHAAHEAGIIHRDVKPGNIIVTPEGQPVVLDFGLARLQDDETPSLTGTGEIFGTPAYMSPEQVASQALRLDHRTDIYSLGVTLFEAVTLRRPFDQPTRDALYQAILTHPAPDPRRINPQVPDDLRTIILTAMERDRNRRYLAAEVLAEDLRRFREHLPIIARRPGPARRAWRWIQRNPALAGALGAIFLALSGGLLLAVSLLANNREALRAGEVQRLTAESAAALGRDPGLALLLAAEADRLGSTLATRNAVVRALAGLDEVRTYSGAFQCALSSNGVLVADEAGALSVRSFPGGEEIVRFPEPASLPLVGALVDSGRTAVVLGAGGIVKAWNVQTGQEVATIPLETPPNDIVEGPGPARFCTLESGLVRVFDASRFAPVATIDAAPAVLRAVTATPQGNLVAVCAWDGSVGIHDLDSGQVEEIPRPAGVSETDPSWAWLRPDGRRLFLAGRDGVRPALWSVDDAAEIHRFPGIDTDRVAAFSPDGRLLAVATRRGDIGVFDSGNGARLATLQGHAAPVTCLAFDARGRHLVSGSVDATIRLWRIEDAREIGRLLGHRGTVSGILVSEDADRILSFGSDLTLRIWEPRALRAPPPLSGAEAHAFFPALDPRGGRVVRPRPGGAPVLEVADEVRILKAAAPRWASGIPLPLDRLRFRDCPGAFSSDGRWAAAADPDGGVVIVDARDPGRSFRPALPRSQVTYLAFSGDGSRLIARLRDEGWRAAEVAPDGASIALDVPEDSAGLLAFSRAGLRAVAGGSGDIAPGILDLRTGRVADVLEGTEPALIAAAMSPDGRFVLGAESGGRCVVWSVGQRTPRATLPSRGVAVRSAAWSGDARTIATLSGDSDAWIWDAASGGEILTLEGGPHGFRAAVFRPDGARVVTLDGKGDLAEWPLDPAPEARRRAPRTLTPDERDRHGVGTVEERAAARARWNQRHPGAAAVRR